MTEEEKKTLEFLKEIVIEFDKCNSEYVIDKYDEYGFLNGFRVVLNLIEKQQKEIEELNNRDTNRLSEIGELRTENSYLKQENEYLNCICESDKDNYINKGKIREKIRYLGDEGYYEFNTKRDLEKAIEMFKELLEEK